MFKFIHKTFMIALLSFSTVLAEEDRYHQLTLEGIEFAYNMQIDKATEIFDELIKLDPNNPHGYVLQSVNYFYRFQLEENHQQFEEKFKKTISDAIKISRNNLSDIQNRVDALFYLGTAHMYYAAYHGGLKNWFKAYLYGKDGIDYLEKVVEIEPDYYDAYFGLGLYHYYADVMPNFIKTVSSLLGIKGNRIRGLRELELAAEKGTYSKAQAMFFLGNIYLYMEKDYEKSLSYARKLATLYPNNPGFLGFLGENCQKNGYHVKAIEKFQEALGKDATSRYPFYRTISLFNLGNIYFELNEFETAIAYYKRAIEIASKSTGNVKWAHAWSNFKLAESYEMLGNRKAAIHYYKLVQRSNHKRAFELAKKRIQTPLAKIDIDLIKGQNLIKTMNYDRAIAVFERALVKTTETSNDYTNQKIPEIHYHLAKAKYEKEDFQAAIPELKKILSMKDIKEKWIKAQTHFYLGNCYREIGDAQKAIAEYELAYKFGDKELRFEIDKSLSKTHTLVQ